MNSDCGFYFRVDTYAHLTDGIVKENLGTKRFESI